MWTEQKARSAYRYVEDVTIQTRTTQVRKEGRAFRDERAHVRPAVFVYARVWEEVVHDE